ncbi:hypothetical protein D3C85_1262000 [compost metagenome]
MPSPSPANTSMPASGGRTSAVPSAAAMKGPVQGVATKAASTPVQKAPRAPPLLVSSAPALMVPSSNNPARLKAMMQVSSNSSSIMRGSCSWKAQPIWAPPARRASSRPPSTMHIAITPTV